MCDAMHGEELSSAVRCQSPDSSDTKSNRTSEEREKDTVLGSPIPIVSMSSSGYAPARQPYLGSFSSVSRPGGHQPILPLQTRSPRCALGEPNLDNLEVAFLRVISRNQIPIAKPDEIQLDCVDRRFDTTSRHGATMQVHRGT
jgi:hypothetical protein